MIHTEISGFLALQQVSAVVKETLVQRVYEWRERPRSVSGNDLYFCTIFTDSLSLAQLMFYFLPIEDTKKE